MELKKTPKFFSSDPWNLETPFPRSQNVFKQLLNAEIITLRPI